MRRLFFASLLLGGCIDFDRLKGNNGNDFAMTVPPTDLANTTDAGQDMSSACVVPQVSGTWRAVQLATGGQSANDIDIDRERAYVTVGDPALWEVDLDDPALARRKIAADIEEEKAIPIAHLAVVGPRRLAVAGHAETGDGYTVRELVIGTDESGGPVDQFIPGGFAYHGDGTVVQGVAAFDGTAYVGLLNAITGTTKEVHGVISAFALSPANLPSSRHELPSNVYPYAVHGGSFGVFIGEVGRIEFTDDGTDWTSLPAPDPKQLDVPRAIASADVGGVKRTWMISTHQVCSIVGSPKQSNAWTQAGYTCGALPEFAGPTDAIASVATSPCAPDFGVIVGTGGQLFLSTDGGKSWTPDAPTALNQTKPFLQKVVITRRGRIAVVANDGSLYVRP